MSSPDARYWLGLGKPWTGTARDQLWRRHCDAVNARLLARWLPETPVARLAGLPTRFATGNFVAVLAKKTE